MRNAGNLVSRASIWKPLRRRVGKFEFAFVGINAETFRFKRAEMRQPNVLTFFFSSPLSLSLCLSLSNFLFEGEMMNRLHRRARKTRNAMYEPLGPSQPLFPTEVR